MSAHFPPNLVSGGTLVPQRIATGLARRGHDVWVYAGYLGEDRSPLETWSESQGEVTVRWIATTPWTAWSDPRNSINPDVAADFRGWLAQVRPDVVHLHSLQTLGASLVAEAKASGARVVVTMHDFWWVCARQFLVDRDVQPCGLVVACSTCRCAATHRWLERRDRDVQAFLGDADVILAPSASSARVLAANGIDTGRLRVDENGLPELESAAEQGAEARDGVPVRFMFAGGVDPMKGLGVLLAAVPLMPSSGWTLDLYGVRDSGVVDGRVRALPSYRRDEMAGLMAEHDVLVLPSVMRESHSIVTREALAAGLAVVCTDTLGPEEAVRHGVNGMVVPAADHRSLAAAMRSLVTEVGLLDRLRAAPLVAPIRPFEDQLDGLDDLYRELTAGDTTSGAGPAEAAERALLRRVLLVVGIQGAALRYRGRLPAEALRLRGVHVDVRHYRDPEVRELAAAADAVVLYRVPATVQIRELVAAIRRRDRAVPVLFDIDDLIFDPDLRGEVHGLHVLSEAEEALWWRGVTRYRTTMELCDAYVGSTEELCRHATATTGLPAHRYANGVGVHLGRLSETALAAPRDPGPLRIGYFSGTNTHDADWATVEPALVRVLAAHPEVELWLGGLLTTGPALVPFADRVRRLPMLPWHELPLRLRQVDVNLAPLVLGSRFNEAKSAIKWLEAALVQTPTVASPTEPFREAVEHGRTGMLAADEDAWVEAITALLDDELLRRRVGALARREALLRWGPHTQGARYLEVLHAAARQVREHGPRRASAWEPVLDDEPWDAAAGWLEPYPGAIGGRGELWRRLSESAAVDRARAAWRVLRAGGPRALASKVVEVARRA